MSGVRSAPSRHPHQQIALQAFINQWVLQMHQHAKSMEAQNEPISFTLVVNNVGIKYVGKEHVNHLIWCIKQKYELTKGWTGDLYCMIKLNWDYNAHSLDISMPGYIKKLLLQYKHCMPSRPQDCPYASTLKQYVAKA
jgi:hypothetical protein